MTEGVKRLKLDPNPWPIWYKIKRRACQINIPLSTRSGNTVQNTCIADLIIALQKEPGSPLAQVSSENIDTYVDVEAKTVLKYSTLLAELVDGNSEDNPLLVEIMIPKEPKSNAPFYRSISDADFIAKEKLNLSKSGDAVKYTIYWYEKTLEQKGHRLGESDQMTFEDNCLEHRLDKPMSLKSSHSLEANEKLKLLLAVSGAGKTRTLLEYLYANLGYYFVVSSSQTDFGSNDMRRCMGHCNANPDSDRVKRAIKLLYFIRVTVCNHLVSLGFNDPSMILLAQLHPVTFFGVDIFDELFENLIKEPTFNFQIGNPFKCLAIDEIQQSLGKNGYDVHSLSGSIDKRPFFTPLVNTTTRMTMFSLIILSGTGINYRFLTESLEAVSLKEGIKLDYEVVSCFHPLSKIEVVKYSREYLTDHGISGEGLQVVVNQIASFELCHGRARFITVVLENYLKYGIEFAVAKFATDLANLASPIFPLRFVLDDLRSEGHVRVIGKESLFTKLHRGFLKLIYTGKCVLTFDDDNSASAIRYGLGFGEILPQVSSSITVTELAVVECLRCLLPFGDLVQGLQEQMSLSPNPQTVGYLMEYLVAFALVSKYDPDAVQNIRVFRGPVAEYMKQDAVSGVVCFPDHVCGPDIVYKFTKMTVTKILFVQVKFVLGLSKQERALAWNTTDPSQFYCNRTSKELLRGHEKKHDEINDVLKDLKNDGVKIERMLVVHTHRELEYEEYEEDEIVTCAKNPNFFDCIRPGSEIWQFLDNA